MSVFDKVVPAKVRAKAEEMFGRATELYGESHGDAAAEVSGEAHRLEGEADEEAADRADHEHRDDAP